MWLAAGLAAWLVARIVPFGRGQKKFVELSISAAMAVILGLTATALDFGGWKEPDWRAGLFAFFGALAAAGVFRLVTFFRAGSLQ